MNILVLSDLNWEQHLRSITESEVLSFDPSRISILRYQSIYRYLQIIEAEKADLVLFAGDVTGDGSCGHGFHHAFNLLLSILEQKQIPSLFISGNHDDPRYYNQVVSFTNQLKYSHDINNKVVTVNGLKILGIPYSTSKFKKKLKSLIDANQNQHHIVLAHAQLKRRIRLFDIPTKYIFTGHYDRKLCAHRATVFTALDNDSSEISYALLQFNQNDSDKIHFKIKPNNEVVFNLSENCEQLIEGNRNPILKINESQDINLLEMEAAPYHALINERGNYLYFKYLRGQHYVNSLNTMFKIKNKLPLSEDELTLEQIFQLQITDAYKISQSLIEDYLGKQKIKKNSAEN